MKIKYRKFSVLFMVIVLIISLSITAFAAKRVDRRFVDSADHTGYYVDINSIDYSGGDNMKADIYIVKPQFNAMFMYTTEFNLKEKSYQFVYTKIYEYDTRRLTSQSSIPAPKAGYGNLAAGNNKLMENVVEFALEWERTHINKTKLGELLD